MENEIRGWWLWGVMSNNLFGPSGLPAAVLVSECLLPIALCASKLLEVLQTIESAEEPDIKF